MSAARTLTLALLASLAVAPASAEDLAIRNVTVIDPASRAVLPARSVLIDGGTIVSVAPSLPEGARPEVTVDGTGRFLVPGLWDMHTHLDSHADTDLAMLVVNGVLFVRDMGGDPFSLAERQQRVADGEIVGPTIRGAGSILEDRAWLERARTTFPTLEHRLPVDSPEEARATIDLLASWGVDLVKIRNVTDTTTLAAILAAAAERGLTVAGHEPVVVDIDEAARLGMTTFEHLPFLTLTMPGKQADAGTVEQTAGALVESGAYIDPTIVASRGLGLSREERAARIERPDERYEYLPDSVKAEWIESVEDDPGPLPWADMVERSIEMAKVMLAAGVPFLSGTDMGVPLTFPGSSLHEELELMAERLELEPMEVLRTATSHPAELFGAATGSVAPGMSADLVLLSADPLEDIANVGEIEAVVLRGELLDRSRLDGLLARVRAEKDLPPVSTPYERMEARCAAGPTAECLERLAGYRFSKMLYSQARATYARALAAGAGVLALEGLFASEINLLHGGEGDCAAAVASAERLLARNPGDLDKEVGVLDRLLPALDEGCPEETRAVLRRVATLDATAVGEEMRPFHRRRYATYLARVEGDEAAAYAYRIEAMPPGWREDPTALGEVAAWCLAEGIALDTARELARRATGLATSGLDRLRMMLLEARIAGATGDYRGAVALLETLDEAVPGNATITGLLERFRESAQRTVSGCGE
jgi:imidazolonepropionase-like amidohydrolase